jgi:drug/metabolite transporter (DMT)-like permease
MAINEEMAPAQRSDLGSDRPDRSAGATMAAYIPLILFTVLTNAAAQIMLKQGMLLLGAFELSPGGLMAVAPRVVLNPFVILGLCTFVVSMGSHLMVLSRVDLSFAYPFLSLAYVVATLYAYFVFHEDVTPYRVAGIGLICLGTILISRS